MKISVGISFLFIFFFNLISKAQNLPNRVSDQPDGITIHHFDVNATDCLPKVFIGEELQLLFPCASKDNYRRIDISLATKEISRLKQLLTSNFILKLQNCCIRKNCGDAISGYYLMTKTGNANEYIFLDHKYANADKCGTGELKEIIELLEKINKNYR